MYQEPEESGIKESGNVIPIPKKVVLSEREENKDSITFIFLIPIIVLLGLSSWGVFTSEPSNLEFEVITEEIKRVEVVNKEKTDLKVRSDVVDADIVSIEYLGSLYTKDRNNIYYRNQVVEGADLKTFEYVSGAAAKDKNNVYDKGIIMEENEIEVLNQKVLGGEYVQRGDKIYHNWGGFVEGADSSSFVHLGGNYAKDKNRAYLYAHIIYSADVATFTHVADSYAKDKNSIFLGVGKISADISTFRYVGGHFAVDKDNVYYAGPSPVVDGADPKTLEYVGAGYVKDVNKVFFGGNEMVGADPSFCTINHIEGCRVK